MRFKKERGKWQARIQQSGKERHLGYYLSREDAIEAYRIESERVFCEFSRTGVDHLRCAVV